MILIFILMVLMARCNRHDRFGEEKGNKEIIKQAEEGAAVLEELNEAEKGFWS